MPERDGVGSSPPSGASTWEDDGSDRRAPGGPGSRTSATTDARPDATRRSAAPLERSERHRGSPRALPDTSAPRHSAPPTCRECRGSGGASVTLQVKPCHPSAGAEMSRIRRNHTGTPWGGQDLNLRPTDYES